LPSLYLSFSFFLSSLPFFFCLHVDARVTDTDAQIPPPPFFFFFMQPSQFGLYQASTFSFFLFFSPFPGCGGARRREPRRSHCISGVLSFLSFFLFGTQARAKAETLAPPPPSLLLLFLSNGTHAVLRGRTHTLLVRRPPPFSFFPSARVSELSLQ